jgi:hypothetical protein
MNNTLSNIDANTKKEILGSGEMKI